MSAVIERHASNTISITQELVATGSNYRWDACAFTAMPNTLTTHTLTYPFPVTVLSATVQTAEENRGDFLSWYVSHNTVVGVVTSAVTAGTTVLPVSSTVVSMCFIGMKITLFDATHTDVMGFIVGISTENSTVTVSVAPTHDFAAGSYIRISVVYLDNVEIGHPLQMDLGQAKITGTYVPANTLLTCVYDNRSGGEKRIVGNFEFLY
jgi:hypothetical protein